MADKEIEARERRARRQLRKLGLAMRKSRSEDDVDYIVAGIVYHLRHDKDCPHNGSPGLHCFRPAKRKLDACPQHQQASAMARQELNGKLRIFRSGTDAAMDLARLAADIPEGFG